MKTTITLFKLALFAPLVFLIGCGGGTEAVPKITAKPKKAASKTGSIPEVIPPKKPSKDPGTFSGRIVFDGTPPKIESPSSFDSNSTKTDPFCVKNKGDVKDLSLVVSNTGGVKNVFVYVIKKPKGHTPKAAPKTAKPFDQKGCTFLPHAIIVRVGQPVEVTNSDQTAHNTHTYPLKPGNSAFSKIVGYKKKESYTFEESENTPVKVGCDIHGWMIAYQLPVSDNFFALTGEDGKFEIKGLAPGDYKFRLWHEKAGYLEKTFDVTIEGGDTVNETFTYPSSKFASFSGPAPKVVSLSSTR